MLLVPAMGQPRCVAATRSCEPCEMCDVRSEVYDPEKVSMVDLLRWFWESHDPTQGNGQGNDRGTQYRLWASARTVTLSLSQPP